MRRFLVVSLVVFAMSGCSGDAQTSNREGVLTTTSTTEATSPAQTSSTRASATTTTTTAPAMTTVAPATSVTTTTAASVDVSPTESRSSRGCGVAEAAPGDYEQVNEANEAGQKYWTVVPESYSFDEPLPLYLLLAAGGGDAYQNYAGWRPLIGDPRGLFVVADTRTTAQSQVETYLGLIEELVSDYCVDLDRIHIIGSSWSAGLAARLMCEMPDTFASFADSVGSFGNLGSCEPIPKPLIAMTGDFDRTAVVDSAARWATINECDPDPKAEDLGSGITRHTYRGCAADVVLYDFQGMGHQLAAFECTGPAGSYCAEYEDFDSFQAWEEFFAEHPLP